MTAKKVMFSEYTYSYVWWIYDTPKSQGLDGFRCDVSKNRLQSGSDVIPTIIQNGGHEIIKIIKLM